MKRIAVLTVTLLLLAVGANAQATYTDVYHVHINKAALGQAKALEASLAKPAAGSAMPEHTLVLKHQDGDDWDYMVIQHLGKKFTIDPAQYTPPTGAAAGISAWHADTIVAGPAWDVFAKEMGFGADAPKNSVYVVATWRAAPGHRNQLEKTLTTVDPNAKVKTGTIVLGHLEGGPWNFLTLQRYNSWQDYATDEAANQDGAPWYEIRDHGISHHDTITTRVPLSK